MDCHDKLIHARPNDGRMWCALARALESLERFSDAIKCYKQSLTRTYPQPPAAFPSPMLPEHVFPHFIDLSKEEDVDRDSETLIQIATIYLNLEDFPRATWFVTLASFLEKIDVFLAWNFISFSTASIAPPHHVGSMVSQTR